MQKTPPPAEQRKALVFCASFMFVIQAITLLVMRAGILGALIGALTTSLGGVLGWNIYFAISHRYEGQLFFMIPLITTQSRFSLYPLPILTQLEINACLVLIIAILAVISGLALRGREKPEPLDDLDV